MADSGGRSPANRFRIRSASLPMPRQFFQDQINFVLLRLREVRSTFQGFHKGLEVVRETLENMRNVFEQADGRFELLANNRLGQAQANCHSVSEELKNSRDDFTDVTGRIEQLRGDFQLANGRLEQLHDSDKLNQDRLALHELDMAAIRMAIKELGMAIMRLNDFVGTLTHAHRLPHRNDPQNPGTSATPLCHGIAVGDDGAPANGCPHFREDCPLRFSYHAETNAPKIELSD
ncbi:hypothetical protein AC1031_018887 [Aphanomyces cochlioides]|nr:hypothetical protein AC1031_018887 [Aphanomyces cochlioides]